MTRAPDLAALPLVLCGPLLRRVDPEAVTVWVTLREPATVRLVVHDERERVLQEGHRDTVALGAHLHVAAVTSSGQRLAWEQTYMYGVSFDGRDLFDVGVVAGGRDAARKLLLYEDGPPHPSFVMPPRDVRSLHVVHGSCRRPHGEGEDMLATVDALIARSFRGGDARPHRLFLTGDQIYADDVGDPMLAMLTPLGDELLGWQELLPDVDTLAAHLAPGSRSRVVAGAGIAGEPHVTKSHLLAWGEFCAMYLLVWSEVLWPEELAAVGERGIERERLEVFRSSIWRVRRALANVPATMMWDDHEITDGWFINIAWAERVLGTALGRRVMTNAMAAFAVFQAWGNNPSRFGEGTAGAALLDALARWRGRPDEAEEAIRRAVGLPRVDVHGLELERPENALRWDVRLDAPDHTTVVLDTRSRRGYTTYDDDEPALVSDAELDRIIGDVPPGDLLLLVSPPPLVHVPAVNRQKQSLGMFEADRELWEHYPPALRRLLDHLFAHAPAVVLCGDVHLGFSSTLTRGDAGPAVAQLASSPLRNETEAKRRFHAAGYDPDSPGADPPEVSALEGVAVRYLRADVRDEQAPDDAGSAVVGVNNIGVVTFEQGERGLVVRHTLWWTGDDDPSPLTSWTIPLGRYAAG